MGRQHEAGDEVGDGALSLLCACTDTEMCRECKFTSEISRAYERTKRQLLRDWWGEISGQTAVCVGARDTRDATLVGKIKPGDAVLHSTGPLNKT